MTAPVFSYGLYDTTVATGDSFSFYPSFSGSGPITYQWKKDGVAIPGETGLGLRVPVAATGAAMGFYWVTVTEVGSAGEASTDSDVAVRPENSRRRTTRAGERDLQLDGQSAALRRPRGDPYVRRPGGYPGRCAPHLFVYGLWSS